MKTFIFILLVLASAASFVVASNAEARNSVFCRTYTFVHADRPGRVVACLDEFRDKMRNAGYVERCVVSVYRVPIFVLYNVDINDTIIGFDGSYPLTCSDIE